MYMSGDGAMTDVPPQNTVAHKAQKITAAAENNRVVC